MVSRARSAGKMPRGEVAPSGVRGSALGPLRVRAGSPPPSARRRGARPGHRRSVTLMALVTQLMAVAGLNWIACTPNEVPMSVCVVGTAKEGSRRQITPDGVPRASSAASRRPASDRHSLGGWVGARMAGPRQGGQESTRVTRESSHAPSPSTAAACRAARCTRTRRRDSDGVGVSASRLEGPCTTCAAPCADNRSSVRVSPSHSADGGLPGRPAAGNALRPLTRQSFKLDRLTFVFAPLAFIGRL